MELCAFNNGCAMKDKYGPSIPIAFDKRASRNPLQYYPITDQSKEVQSNYTSPAQKPNDGRKIIWQTFIKTLNTFSLPSRMQSGFFCNQLNRISLIIVIESRFVSEARPSHCILVEERSIRVVNIPSWGHSRLAIRILNHPFHQLHHTTLQAFPRQCYTASTYLRCNPSWK